MADGDSCRLPSNHVEADLPPAAPLDPTDFAARLNDPVMSQSRWRDTDQLPAVDVEYAPREWSGRMLPEDMPDVRKVNTGKFGGGPLKSGRQQARRERELRNDPRKIQQATEKQAKARTAQMRRAELDAEAAINGDWQSWDRGWERWDWGDNERMRTITAPLTDRERGAVDQYTALRLEAWKARGREEWRQAQRSGAPRQRLLAIEAKYTREPPFSIRAEAEMGVRALRVPQDPRNRVELPLARPGEDLPRGDGGVRLDADGRVVSPGTNPVDVRTATADDLRAYAMKQGEYWRLRRGVDRDSPNFDPGTIQSTYSREMSPERAAWNAQQKALIKYMDEHPGLDHVILPGRPVEYVRSADWVEAPAGERFGDTTTRYVDRGGDPVDPPSWAPNDRTPLREGVPQSYWELSPSQKREAADAAWERMTPDDRAQISDFIAEMDSSGMTEIELSQAVSNLIVMDKPPTTRLTPEQAADRSTAQKKAKP